jgi:hypothetical protein
VAADEEEDDAIDDVDIRLVLVVVRCSSFSPSPADKLTLSRMLFPGSGGGGWLGPSGIAERRDPVELGLGSDREEVDEVADEESE